MTAKMGRPRVDLAGKVYGRLTVLGPDPGNEHDVRHPKWKCQCHCGKKTVVSGSNLVGGNTKSCGCLAREARRRQAVAMFAANKAASR